MIEVRQVLRVLGADEESRAMVMGAFRAAGGSLDRWRKVDLEAMAGAITRAEDALELRRDGAKRGELRLRLRDVRRRIEDQLR